MYTLNGIEYSKKDLWALLVKRGLIKRFTDLNKKQQTEFTYKSDLPVQYLLYKTKSGNISAVVQ